MSDIVAGIVTYNPDIQLLRDNLNAILPQVSRVIIADNNSINKQDISTLCLPFKSVQVIYLDENLGIATALNTIFKFCDGKTQWVLTLDQDSLANKNMVYELLQQAVALNAVSLCPCVVERINLSSLPNTSSVTPMISEVNECITSGNLIKHSAWKTIGGFNDELFIDQVDFEFCYRLRRAGYHIYQVNSAVLIHEIGSPIKKQFLWKKISLFNHSAFRKYYIFRNGLFVKRHYPKESKNLKIGYDLVKNFLFMVLYEDDKLNKLSRAIRGIIDSRKLEYHEELHNNY